MNPFDHVLSVRIKGDAEGPQTGDVVLDGSSLHDWKEDEEYKAGDVVVYNSQLWQANEDFTSGENWEPEYWTQIGIPDIVLPGFEAFHQYQQYQTIAEGGKIYRAKVAFQSNSTFNEGDWEGLSGVTNTYTSDDGTVVITLNNEQIDYSVKAWTDNIVNDFNTALTTKVDKVTGKMLTSNDFTTAQKNKLDALQNITEIGNNLVLTDGRLDAGFTISFDTNLNKNSTNAVQNRAVAQKFEDLEDSLADVATSGDYTDLINTPDINDKRVRILLNNGTTQVGAFTLNQNTDKDISLPAAAAEFNLTFDENYVLHLRFIDQTGAYLGEEQTVDLPLESMVVNGSYDNVNQRLILTLKNGNTIYIPISSLIDSLQKELEVVYSSANLKATLQEIV